MVMNRIADVFFLFGIILIFFKFKTTDFFVVFQLLPYISKETIIFLNFDINLINLIAFFLFIGAIGKSAQIGLHTWLPKAMEGPTPVSALLHAATMVTAGVFLVIRSSIFFEYSDGVLNLLCIFGAITALFSGMVATFQYDIKRIIAYSTCSQLGYMFFSCGLSNYFVAFFHLFNHAFFKALLFLSAGALIHALFDEQDIRKMGNLCTLLPFIYISIFVGSLAILGFPFLSGFYSKDVILELAYSRYYIDALFVYIMAILAAIFTAIYSLKLFYYVFFHNKNYYYFLVIYWTKNVTESLDLMFVSLISLLILSIFSGYLFSDMFLGYGSAFWNNSIFVFSSHYNYLEVEFISPLIKNLPIILCFFFIFVLLLIFVTLDYNEFFTYNPRFFIKFGVISSFFYYALFFDNIYNNFYKNILNYTYLVSTKYMDKGILELIGPWGAYKFFHFLNVKLSNNISPLIFYYLFVFFLGFFFIIISIYIFLVLDLAILQLNIGLFLFSICCFIYL